MGGKKGDLTHEGVTDTAKKELENCSLHHGPWKLFVSWRKGDFPVSLRTMQTGLDN